MTRFVQVSLASSRKGGRDRSGKRTVEDRALEEADKLEEHVLLFGDELVPARMLSAALDLDASQTVVDMSGEPVIRSHKVGEVGLGTLAGEFPPW